MFDRKGDAEAWLTQTRHDLVRGLHTPGSVSPTVREAGALWLKRCHEKALERMTTKGYEEHCNLHIYPFIGKKSWQSLPFQQLTPLPISSVMRAGLPK